MRTITHRPCEHQQCPHCGEWHYGRGSDREIARRVLDSKIEQCRRERLIAGLLPVTPKQSHTTETRA